MRQPSMCSVFSSQEPSPPARPANHIAFYPGAGTVAEMVGLISIGRAVRQVAVAHVRVDGVS
jgi:hypothetical protein